MLFGSVCSGIEAASIAFAPLGWKAAWLAEVEPFAAAVLAHHYPGTPNLGDMTALPARVLAGEIAAPDVLCGGTPCQAFSVAGMREGLNDPRGQLTIKFVELADAIDHVRVSRGDAPCIPFWENVPGVLSDRGNAFGCFLGALSGEDCELQPPGGKWKDSGCVYGPTRTVAWRVLDAQYFGLAQRRRRVFVVASARNDFDPCAVLFESDSLRRDIAPSREQGQVTAGTFASRTTGGGFPGTDEACSGYIQPVSATLDASYGRLQGASGQYLNHSHSTLVIHGTQDPCVSRDSAFALGRNNGQENAVFAIRTAQQSSNGWGIQPEGPAYTLDTHAANGQAVCVTGSVTHTLRAEGADASEDGTGRGTPIVAVPHVEVMPTMRAGAPNAGKGHGARSGDSKDEYIVPVAFAENSRGELRLEGGNGLRTGTLNTGGGKPGQGIPCVAYTTKLHNTKSNNSGKVFEERAPCLDANSPAPALLTASQVRRLTPTECERLMGFPDGYTDIPWTEYQRIQKLAAKSGSSFEEELKKRGKVLRGPNMPACPDGPRYKALGNSWAVPVPRWIAQRIQLQLARA
ncbi:DNA cytosine methyltransferase [Comamonas thiooxydans]|uniref:DNA cytosine methyltransferase n=1 Tax=Comamonas thiooxydans TaxID=363952 RepID=UPI00057AA4C3|nr:DNA cytosine methyltransferase [Comamonas thiooxydans]